MNKTLKALLSWAITAWIVKVFAFSLPYKFSNAADTQHIFGTIGGWMASAIDARLGAWFIEFGARAVGSVELLTCIVLLTPALLWVVERLTPGGSSVGVRARCHCLGGLMAAAVMAGAVFFHLATPLGIAVLHEGVSDGGSLFYAAVSIMVLGAALFAINLRQRAY